MVKTSYILLQRRTTMPSLFKQLTIDFKQEWKSFMDDFRSSKAAELARWEEPPVMVEKPKPSAVVVKHPAPPSAHSPSPAPLSAHVEEMEEEEETDWANTAICLSERQARRLRAKLKAVAQWEEREDELSSAPTPVRVHFGPDEVFPVPCEGKGRPTPKRGR